METQTAVAKRRGSEPPELIHFVRGDLDWIVMKTLEKDRTRRYETANGLASDIKRFLNNEPIVARSPSQIYRLQKLILRNKLAFAAGITVTAALVLGLGLSTMLLFKERKARARAVAAEKDALAEKKVAEAAALQTKLAWATSDFSQAISHIAADKCSEAVAFLVRCLSADPGNEAALTRLFTLLTYHSWMLPTATISNSSISYVDVSPDARRIVTASGNSARIWDVQNGQPLAQPLQHGATLTSARFSPGAEWIVTASLFYTRLWDAVSGQPLAKPWSRDLACRINSFSSDGGKNVTVSSNQTVQVWDVKGTKPVTAPLKLNGVLVSAQLSQRRPAGHDLVGHDRAGKYR